MLGIYTSFACLKMARASPAPSQRAPVPTHLAFHPTPHSSFSTNTPLHQHIPQPTSLHTHFSFPHPRQRTSSSPPSTYLRFRPHPLPTSPPTSIIISHFRFSNLSRPPTSLPIHFPRLLPPPSLPPASLSTYILPRSLLARLAGLAGWLATLADWLGWLCQLGWLVGWHPHAPPAPHSVFTSPPSPPSPFVPFPCQPHPPRPTTLPSQSPLAPPPPQVT